MQEILSTIYYMQAKCGALDVAKYILKQCGQMSAMKLQKLVYYSQAWSLVWDDRPLFENEIQAWANGPVIVDLYGAHRGRFLVSEEDIPGNPAKLDAPARGTVNSVIKFYGSKAAHWLSALTHREQPWVSARTGLKPGERGSVTITQASMAEYYGSLV
jgi:uncharacterized phage-associated protein